MPQSIETQEGWQVQRVGDQLAIDNAPAVRASTEWPRPEYQHVVIPIELALVIALQAGALIDVELVSDFMMLQPDRDMKQGARAQVDARFPIGMFSVPLLEALTKVTPPIRGHRTGHVLGDRPGS